MSKRKKHKTQKSLPLPSTGTADHAALTPNTRPYDSADATPPDAPAEPGAAGEATEATASAATFSESEIPSDVWADALEQAEEAEARVAAPEQAPAAVVEFADDDDADARAFDAEMTINLVGAVPTSGRDDLDSPTLVASGQTTEAIERLLLQRKHLRGLLEALVFAADSPIKVKDLAKLASAPQKQIKELLAELQDDYSTHGIHLDEVNGGWVFRTNPQYAPFVRDLTKQKPVRLTRAQVETLAIIAYRQPMTRPEVDEVRGVDTGPVLKLLLERDLVRILGKRDEPGRPLIYGTTGHFLEFFGLKSLKDLPTLREFTELSDESREVFEEELGEAPAEPEKIEETAEAPTQEASDATDDTPVVVEEITSTDEDAEDVNLEEFENDEGAEDRELTDEEEEEFGGFDADEGAP